MVPLTAAERHVTWQAFPEEVEQKLQEHLGWWTGRKPKRIIRVERRYETLGPNGEHSNYYVKVIVDSHRQVWYFSKTVGRWRKTG
jgi:hypothetical protein